MTGDPEERQSVSLADSLNKQVSNASLNLAPIIAAGERQQRNDPVPTWHDAAANKFFLAHPTSLHTLVCVYGASSRVFVTQGGRVPLILYFSLYLYFQPYFSLLLLFNSVINYITKLPTSIPLSPSPEAFMQPRTPKYWHYFKNNELL